MPALSWLDQLPAWLRHLLIAFFAAFFGDLGDAVFRAGGISTLPWPATELHALDAAAVALFLAGSALWGTPLTRQYGVGAKTDPLPPVGMQSSAGGPA